MKYVLSYGGGLNSTALLVYLVKNDKPLDLVIFADTGNEFEHTYQTVEYYKNWLHQHYPAVKFEIVNSKYGMDLYTYAWNKKIVPNRMKRDCTTKFKILPIKHYLRETYGKQETFIQYIGISLEEAHRMRDSDVKYSKLVYPLVDAAIDRDDCVDLLKQYNLPVPEKSGCWFCPFTNKANWIKLYQEHPDLFQKSIELEQNSSRYPNTTGLLWSKPLIKLPMYQNKTMKDYEPTCDVVGSCFL